jgi:hypothetical protein
MLESVVWRPDESAKRWIINRLINIAIIEGDRIPPRSCAVGGYGS